MLNNPVVPVGANFLEIAGTEVAVVEFLVDDAEGVVGQDATLSANAEADSGLVVFDIPTAADGRVAGPDVVADILGEFRAQA